MLLPRVYEPLWRGDKSPRHRCRRIRQLLGGFHDAALATLEVLRRLVLHGHRRHIGALARFHPATNPAGVGEVSVLAKGIEDHQGHRPITHFRHQHQAVTGLVGEAGLGQLNIPIILVDQVISVAKAQAVNRLAEDDGLLLGGAQFAQQGVFASGDQQPSSVSAWRGRLTDNPQSV